MTNPNHTPSSSPLSKFLEPIDAAVDRVAAEASVGDPAVPPFARGGVRLLTPVEAAREDANRAGLAAPIVTPHAAALSWVFTEVGERLRHSFSEATEAQFFGGLAAAASAAIAADPDVSAADLMRAVLRAAPAVAHHTNGLEFVLAVLEASGEGSVEA